MIVTPVADRQARQVLEPTLEKGFSAGILKKANTTDTDARIFALRQLKAAGIDTAAMICPVVPCMTDVKRLIRFLAGHAGKIWIYGLSVSNRDDINWRNVQRILESHFPNFMDKIESAIFSRDHGCWESLRNDLFESREKRNLDLCVHVWKNVNGFKCLRTARSGGARREVRKSRVPVEGTGPDLHMFPPFLFN